MKNILRLGSNGNNDPKGEPRITTEVVEGNTPKLVWSGTLKEYSARNHASNIAIRDKKREARAAEGDTSTPIEYIGSTGVTVFEERFKSDGRVF